MERFSDRVGATQPRREIQIGSIDQSLRNGLWNWVLWMLEDGERTWGNWHRFAKNGLWDQFFRLPVDEVPHEVQHAVKRWYGTATWFDVYNFVEYTLQNANNARDYSKRHEAERVLNAYLQRDLSGYTAIRGHLVPVTTETEVAEVRQAGTPVAGFEGVAQHIDTALSLLGKKPQPDYRNSIKESISAVEAAVKLLTGEKSGGIDKALTILDKGRPLHPSFKMALQKLYAYTSDDDGIRHPILEASTTTFEEAKFMLVACSAFVNFLIAGQRAQ